MPDTRAFNAQAADWWQTEIIDMRPGEIRYRGYPIEELIGRIGFADMVWLMIRGELPSAAQSALFEAALVSAVDHGPQAPSIAIARMAMTCGSSLNNALASAVNVLDDIHGGAGEQVVELFQSISTSMEAGSGVEEATRQGLADWRELHGKIVPGFGHRFHPIDPRAPRLLALVEAAAERGEVNGRHARIAREVERQLQADKGKPIPLNIDGATAVIYAELDFPAPLARGLFCLSRSVGILAHAWEQQCQGGRNKGPMPKGWLWDYRGHPPRSISTVTESR
ncbi:citryl-CoA lyase [Billgrantia pellis]|uniref:citrate synthase (unknown stereospecificity) n=1 Tax=Billgrantia pellis TaxID=2606936 RepID=A0A7V7FY67_9GAMM|nr:citryl-CoA lyase [Halomonas pellis]KAA0011336.1 citryl-CoA lyase [Halomonas pellis]